MDRRSFVRRSAALAAAGTLPGSALAAVPAPWADGTIWSTYEVTTHVELDLPDGQTRVWLPMPLTHATDYFKPVRNRWTGNADIMRVHSDPRYDLNLLYAEWPTGNDFPLVTLTSTFRTRDRAVDLSRPRKFRAADPDTLQRFLAATELLPTDGIVRDTALKATQGAGSDLLKVRRIYDWVVENTSRDPDTRGCGWGDVRTMFETGNFSGKCGDINSVFVAMCRSVGIPARDLYGLRVDASKWPYRMLGTGGARDGDNVTGAQHCRAEVYLPTHGWVPMDPADVRKVMLEEPPGNVPLTHEKVMLVREKLFGAWEMNWMPMNYAHDVVLPNGRGAPLPYLMYPNAETESERKDSLDPAHFRYTIRARRLA